MKLTTLTLALASVTLAFTQTPAPASRLLCVYVDLTSLTPAELTAAQDSAIQFVEKQATPADRIAVMTYSSRLKVLQDFTSDHEKLVAVLRTIMPGQVALSDDASGRLQGIQAAAGMLGTLPEKKAMLYFSSAITRTGDTQTALSATVDSLERANTAIYPVVPGGPLPTVPR